jgi:hypothetical protein
MDPAVLSRLKTHLKLCTALVLIDGKPTGTAFFITDSLLLTCRHVVKDSTGVAIQPQTRAPRGAQVVVPSGQEHDLDLVLLVTTPVPGEQPQPCVLLDEQLDEGDYYIAGYPREDGQEAGLEVFKLEGHPRDATSGAVQQLQLEAGKQVTWGMSGGPVLSASACAVTAIVRSSKDPAGALGGGAIPISRAAEAFDQVRQAMTEPPLAVRDWRDAIGKDLWQRLGRTWDMPARIDLRVQGARHKWCITTDPAIGQQEYVTLDQLGDDVTEAMFRWAQRRRVSVTEEVELLGRLLAKAIFPGAVASYFSTLSNADEVLVRLHIDPETELADIPWELAAVPSRAKAFLAADPQYRFVRIVDSAAAAAPPPAQSRPIQALALVGLPERWIFPTVYRENRNVYEWPKTDEICRNLEKHIAGAGFAVSVIDTPNLYDVRDILKPISKQAEEQERFDILHYVGVGRIGKDGKAELCMIHPEERDEQWTDVEEVLDLAADHGVRLAVLEFVMPPPHQAAEAVTPSSLGDVLRGSIDAVVYTRFPVHPRQFQSFNSPFYQHLGDGQAVETAVQQGRSALEQWKPIEDAACFGWFALSTGPKSDIRLTRPRERRGQERGTIGAASVSRPFSAGRDDAPSRNPASSGDYDFSRS